MHFQQSLKPTTLEQDIERQRAKWQNWENHRGHQNTSELAIRCIQHLQKLKVPAGKAIDLGCDTGNDTIPLLKAGYDVTAVDFREIPLKELAMRVEAEGLPQPEIIHSSFQKMEFPVVDLVFSRVSIPFCGPEYFPDVWKKIDASIPVGGRFCGSLFGVEDGWKDDAATVTEKELFAMFSKYEFEYFFEEKGRETTRSGAEKPCHCYWMIARKVS